MADATRRDVLVVGGAVGIGSLAGCIDGDDGDGDDGETDDRLGEPHDDDASVDVDHENPEGRVEFVEPEDGDTVESPFTVEMDVSDFELVPTDNGELDDDTGHHHVLVDREPVEPGDVIPDGPGYIHLHTGESEIDVDLSSGEYDLIAQPGDSSHSAFDMTDRITVTVENGDGEHDPDDEAPFPQDDADDSDADEDDGDEEPDADEETDSGDGD